MKTVIFILLCLVFNTGGGFSVYSPALYVSIAANVIFSVQFAYKSRNRIKIRNFYASLTFLLLLIVILISSADIYDTLRNFGRLSYILSFLLLTELYPKTQLLSVIRVFFLVVIIDILYRYLFADIFSFYQLKNSIIFIDTNFFSLIFIGAIIPFLWQYKIKNILPLFLIIMLFLSRTGLIAFVINLFNKRIMIGLVFFAMVIIVLMFMNINAVMNLLVDPSLLTKIAILQISVEILVSEPSIFWWGVGKSAIIPIVAEYSQGSSFHVGHNLAGLILELGAVQLVLLMILVNFFILPSFRSIFWITYIFVGIVSLFPVTYLGVCVFLYNNSIWYLKRREVRVR